MSNRLNKRAGGAAPEARPARFAPRAPVLAPGEDILWQGAPAWRGLATRLFHIRAVTAYFALLTLADIGIIRHAEGPGWAAFAAGAPTAIGGLLCAGILAALAAAIARTTRYTLTNHRLILQYGVALSATLSVPLHCVAECSVAVRRDHSGDIALRLFRGATPGYVKLWPHARPWRLRAPMPMLRDLPRAAVAATRIGQALASSVPPAGRGFAPAPH